MKCLVNFNKCLRNQQFLNLFPAISKQNLMCDIQTPKKRVFLLDHEPGGGEPWTTGDDISQTPDTPS